MSRCPAPAGAARRRGLFAAGDRVQLTDPKGRLHTITLQPGGRFFTHRGSLAHDDLIGRPDGSTATNTTGVEYLALRPLLSLLHIYPEAVAQRARHEVARVTGGQRGCHSLLPTTAH